MERRLTGRRWGGEIKKEREDPDTERRGYDLSALLRARRPGGLVLVCGAMGNSFQKTGTFFGMSGSRNIRKQIIFSLTIPPPEETDWITLLPVFHPQRFSSLDSYAP